MDSLQVLAACRAAFGPTPRRFHWLRAWYLHQPPPEWMHEARDDELWRIFEERKTLLESGRVVWGHLIQANVLLFKEGNVDCPAQILYSEDTFFDSQPEILAHIARRLFALKGTVPDDPELREFAAKTTDEMTRSLREPLPLRLAGGCQTFNASILVHRAHLPKGKKHRGYIAHSVFPLIVSPLTDTVMILPSVYWPRPFIESWRAGYTN